MKFEIEKSVHGWRAQTEFHLKDNRYLHYTTMKRSNGMVVTTANVVHAENGMNVFMPFSDFNVYVLSAKIERVTVKAIREHHHKAVMKHEEVMAKLKAHYSMQEAAV